MHCRSFYLYERGTLSCKTKTGISIQTVLTNHGRICFYVLVESQTWNEEGGNPISIILQDFSKWFYEIGIPVYCKNKSKTILYNSMNREFLMLHQKFFSQSLKNQMVYRLSVHALVVTENGYVGGSVGEGGFICQRKKRVSLNNRLNHKRKNKLFFLGEKREIEIRRLMGKTHRYEILLLYSKAFESVFTEKHVCTFCKALKRHTEPEKVLRELKERNRDVLGMDSYACICMEVKK